MVFSTPNQYEYTRKQQAIRLIAFTVKWAHICCKESIRRIAETLIIDARTYDNSWN